MSISDKDLAEVKRIVSKARGSLSIPPLDCKSTCWDGPCTCSGVYRVMAYSIDVPALRALLNIKDGS